MSAAGRSALAAPTWRAVTFARSAIAVALLVVLVSDRHERAGAALAIQIASAERWREDLHVGDEVHTRALLAGDPHFEIRLYRTGVRAGDPLPQCDASGLSPGRSLAARLEHPVACAYQLLLVVSHRPIVVPQGSLERDVAATTSAGTRTRVIDVRMFAVR